MCIDFRAVDVSFRVIVNPNTQRPHQFIKIEDNYDVIKDVLLELGEDPGTSEIMMQAIIDIGQNTEVIKFTSECPNNASIIWI